jgi:arylsulfatase A-like enzyme/Tfp pilus assembly protein PilF
MRSKAQQFRFGQMLTGVAFLLLTALLVTLGYRLMPPGGTPGVRSRLGLAQRQVAHDANLVLITIDGLPSGRVGFLGASLPSATPHLDHLARGGFRFEQAITSSPSSLAAHASLMTGLWPATTGVLSSEGGSLPTGRATLTEVLRASGFRTAAFLGSSGVGRWTGLARGFERFDEPSEDNLPATLRPYCDRPANKVIDAARAWVDENFRGRFFLWVQLADPLAARAAPVVRDRLFKDRSDAEVAAADAEIGRLMDRLSALGVLGHTVVAVASVHGAGQGAHGERGAGVYLYDTTIQIPLMLWVPGVAARDRSIPEQTRLIDLAPTVLDLLRVQPPAGFEGKSLVPLLDPSGGPAGLPALAESESLGIYLGGTPLRALRMDGWKYIEGPAPELYDLRRDPGETRNLAAVQASRTAEMRQALEAIGGPPLDPASPERAVSPQAVALYEEAIEALRAREGERAEKTIEELRAVLERQTLPTPPALTALAGAALRLRGRHADALRLYEEAAKEMEGTRASPGGRKALPGLVLEEIGDCRRRAGDSEGAAAAYREAIGVLPDDPEPHVALGFLSLEAGRPGEAVEAFRSALARVPGDPRALAGLGRAYVDGGEAGAAIVPLQEAIRLAPAPPRPYFDLARAREAMSRTDEAARAYREFLERADTGDLLRGPAAERLRVLQGSQSAVR